MNTMHISRPIFPDQTHMTFSYRCRTGQTASQTGTFLSLKIDVRVEGNKRLKELILWDKNEPYLTLESFAKILLEEHNLSQNYENDIIS